MVTNIVKQCELLEKFLPFYRRVREKMKQRLESRTALPVFTKDGIGLYISFHHQTSKLMRQVLGCLEPGELLGLSEVEKKRLFNGIRYQRICERSQPKTPYRLQPPSSPLFDSKKENVCMALRSYLKQ